MNMKQIEEKGRGFWMSRVPKDTKEEFKKFAYEEFEDDFGMAFKSLWEDYKTNSVTEILAERILKLEEIIEDHLGEDNEEDKDTSEKDIKTLSGKSIRRKRKNE